MFESIIVKNSVSGGPLIDAGRLAECLLLYGRVCVVGNTLTVNALLKVIPPFVALRLMDEGRLEVHYIEHQQAIQSRQVWPGVHRHCVISFYSPDHSKEKATVEAFRKLGGNTGSTRVAANKFRDRVSLYRLQSNEAVGFFQQLLDVETTQQTIAELVNAIAPSYRQEEPVQFRVHGTADAFDIETNLVFDHLTREAYKHGKVAKDAPVTQALLLAILLAFHEEACCAAQLRSEMATDLIGAQVHRLRLGKLLETATASESQWQRFADIVLEDAHAVRAAVNAGKVTVVDVINLLDKAVKFRGWLQEQEPSHEVVREYYKRTVENTWVEKLPAKSTRFVAFTSAGLALDSAGLGGLGTAAGVALGAVDQFLVDKLVAGWKPHHFVEDHLRPALAAKPQQR